MKLSPSPFARVLALTVAFLGFAALPARLQAQSYPPAFSAASSYAVGDQVQLFGNVLRATHAVVPGGFKYDEWELWDVRSGTTVMIGPGQDFANLQAGWAYIQNAHVTDGAYLHLYINTSKGGLNETFTSAFSLDHGSGALISIIGDTPGNILFTFPSSAGFIIDNGHAFGNISGIIISSGSISWTNHAQGLTLLNGATIEGLATSNIFGFEVAIYAYQCASIYVYPTVQILYCNNGVTADFGASVNAGGITYVGQGPTGGGTCFYADHNGTIAASGSTVGSIGSGEQGYAIGAHALNGGVIDANSCSFEYCGTACDAAQGGRITVTGGTFKSNTADLTAREGGTIYATGTTTPDGTSVGVGDGSFIWKT